MKVLKNGNPVEVSYEGLCKDLGFDPTVHFVKVTTRRTITWTAGKADEIMALKRACRDNGYKMSLDLEGFYK